MNENHSEKQTDPKLEQATTSSGQENGRFADIISSLSSRPRESEPRSIETVAFALPPTDLDIKVAPDQFDAVLGKDIAKAFKDNGVKEITVKSNADGSYHLEASLDKAVSVPQDLKKDGCYRLDIGTQFSADVSRDANGKITIDNIDGMTALIDAVLFKGKKVNATIEKIELSKAADGTTKVDTTGSRAGFSRVDTKFKEADFYDTLKKGIEMLEEKKNAGGNTKKKVSSTDLPNLHVA